LFTRVSAQHQEEEQEEQEDEESSSSDEDNTPDAYDPGPYGFVDHSSPPWTTLKPQSFWFVIRPPAHVEEEQVFWLFVPLVDKKAAIGTKGYVSGRYLHWISEQRKFLPSSTVSQIPEASIYGLITKLPSTSRERAEFKSFIRERVWD
jgi:hypothetical protein